MRDRWPRVIAAAALSSWLWAPRAAEAQAGLDQLEDASTPPRGLLRLRTISAWTRIDSRFTANASEPLGAPFTATAFGAQQFAPLAPIQALVQSASATPFTLSLGRARLDATGREETLPLSLEYGVTDRFAVGVVVPIVRRRVAMLFRLDTAGSPAIMGPNPARTNSTIQQNDILVQTEFANAISQLQARLASCTANPGNSGCGTVIAQAPGVIQSSQSFANDLASLYGGPTSRGAAFVPTSQSAAQTAIAGRVSTFNSQFQSLLGTSSTLVQTIPRAAGGPAGPDEFQSYLTSDLGRDSLTTQERLGIGDVEVGAKFQLVNASVSATRRTGIHVAIASFLRLPTGSLQSPSEVSDMRLGEGSVILDSRAAADARSGRFGLLAVAEFAASVHAKDTSSS